MKTKFEITIPLDANLYDRIERLKKFVRVIEADIRVTQDQLKLYEASLNSNQLSILDQENEPKNENKHRKKRKNN